jgi:hypothetical protein
MPRISENRTVYIPQRVPVFQSVSNNLNLMIVEITSFSAILDTFPENSGLACTKNKNSRM